MGKYQGYPEYKETHLEWLREIPNHWEIKRLKYLGEAIIGLTYSPDDVVDSEDEGTLVLRSSNVQNKALAFDDNVFVNKPIPEHLKTRKGDILICARNGSRALIGKNAQIDERAEGMTFGAFMSVFRSPYNDYLSKVFNSALFEYQSGTFLTATINQLTTANLNSFEVPLPPESERQTIANFLDHETAKIDTLIEKQQQLIKLLKEKRQAVISHAVTKGLNPDVPMKDSGVEWLGEVPEHWHISALKHQVSAPIIDGPHVSPTRCDSGIPFISAEAISDGKINFDKKWGFISEAAHKEYSKRYSPQLNDLLIVKLGATTGAIAIVDTEEPFNIWVPLATVRAAENLNPMFVFYLFQSSHITDAIQQSWTFGTQQTLGLGTLSNFRIPVPPRDECEEIAAKLKSETALFDSVITKSSKSLELLKERRTALISAAITGKIDVRNWQAPEPRPQAETTTA